MKAASGLLGLVVLGVLLGVLGARPAHADTISIDLNDFYADGSVTVAGDGSSALLEEDALLSPVLLANVPGLGDPDVIVADTGVDLVFSYVFAEGNTDEDDEFGVFLVDGDTGWSVGSSFEFFAQASGSGEIRWDLSDFVGSTLGLQFQLTALSGDAGLDSTVTISNVRLEGVPGSPVPEPGSMALVAVGLATGGAVRRRRRRAA